MKDIDYSQVPYMSSNEINSIFTKGVTAHELFSHGSFIAYADCPY